MVHSFQSNQGIKCQQKKMEMELTTKAEPIFGEFKGLDCNRLSKRGRIKA
jgi:hypothetical protein